MRFSTCAAFASIALLSVTCVHGVTIGFEDFTEAISLDEAGVSDTYAGFGWGYGDDAGLEFRTFEDSVSDQGWVVATIDSPILSPAPVGFTGSAYAWTGGGRQSMWIDFKVSSSFQSGDFSVLSVGYGWNSSAVTLYGYDGSDNLVATSQTLALTGAMQTLYAGFEGIRYLEIRSNASGSWFAMDNLTVNESPATAVPDLASTAGMLSVGLAGVSFMRRKMRP